MQLVGQPLANSLRELALFVDHPLCSSSVTRPTRGPGANARSVDADIRIKITYKSAVRCRRCIEPTEGATMRPDDAPDLPRPLWGPATRLDAHQLPHSTPVGLPLADPSSVTERSAPPPEPSPQLPGPEVPSCQVPSRPYASATGGTRPAVLIVGAAVAALLVVGSVVVVQYQKSTSSAIVRVPAQPVGTGREIRMTTTAPAPAPTIGTSLVQVSSAAASHPYAVSVAALLDRHFAAINARDYAGWSATVATQRANDQPRSQWLQDYRSTTDGSVVVTSISGGSEDLTVSLSFTSTQNPVDAPPDLPVSRICWDVRWPVADIANGGRIRSAGKGSTTMRAC
jgi:hypothetical protein